MKIKSKVKGRFIFACVLMCFFALFIISNQKTVAKEPVNLSQNKTQIKNYYQNKQYEKDFNLKISQAKSDLEQTLSHKHKNNMAAVFDIDDTLLSSYKCNKEIQFGYSDEHFTDCAKKNDFTPIESSIKFYKQLRSKGIKTYIITGRQEKDRALAIRNLKYIGIKHWDGLFLKPNTYHQKSTIGYKSGIRKRLTKNGNHILFSIGDQWSDLKGGYAKYLIKLPNPMYYIP
jgi:acid phosphatase